MSNGRRFTPKELEWHADCEADLTDLRKGINYEARRLFRVGREYSNLQGVVGRTKQLPSARRLYEVFKWDKFGKGSWENYYGVKLQKQRKWIGRIIDTAEHYQKRAWLVEADRLLDKTWKDKSRLKNMIYILENAVDDVRDEIELGPRADTRFRPNGIHTAHREETFLKNRMAGV